VQRSGSPFLLVANKADGGHGALIVLLKAALEL
jgi:hypothetical protein